MVRAWLMFFPWFIFFNRAAMGWTRFMFYPWFIIIIFLNRAAIGWAPFMFYPRFIIFLTARPWAERGLCSTRGLLFFCRRPDADLHSANFELRNL